MRALRFHERGELRSPTMKTLLPNQRVLAAISAHGRKIGTFRWLIALSGIKAARGCRRNSRTRCRNRRGKPKLSASAVNSWSGGRALEHSAPRGCRNSIHPSLSGESCRLTGYVERPSLRFSLGTPFPTPNRTRNRLTRNAPIRSLSHDITSRYSTPASSRAGRRWPAISASTGRG
jgi:hypothetical protein